MRTVALAALICGFLVTTGCARFPYSARWPTPTGWTESRGKLFDQTWRSKSPDRFLRVAADFNGDGIEDKARLMVNQNTGRIGLWVALTLGDRATNDILLDEVADASVGSQMGIALVGPGTYKTGCGKGYWNCDSTESPEITVRGAALRYFKEQSAESYWVCDSTVNSMRRIWMSD